MNDESTNMDDVPVAKPRGVDMSTHPGEKMTRPVPDRGPGPPTDAIYSIGCAVCVLLLQIGIGMYTHARVVEDGDLGRHTGTGVALLGGFAMLLALGGIVVAIVSWVKRPDAPRWAIFAIALNVLAFASEAITRALMVELGA